MLSVSVRHFHHSKPSMSDDCPLFLEYLPLGSCVKAENLMQAQKTGPFLSFSPSLPQPPCNKESLVTYYGVYSSSHRGKCKRENREERIGEIVVEAVPVSSA